MATWSLMLLCSNGWRMILRKTTVGDIVAPLDWRHTVVPFAIVGVAAFAVTAIVGAEAVGSRLVSTLVVGGLVLICAAPVALAALAGQRWSGSRGLALVAGLLVFNLLSLNLPRVGFFADLDWNWQGKTLDLFWTLALIALLPPMLRREIGWTWKIPPATVPAFLINICLLVIVGFIVSGGRAFGVSGGEFTLERVLYDTTYPNLVEEIVFRGFMLALLDRAFPPNWTFSGARLGWSVILTAWLFGLVHGITTDPSGAVVLDLTLLGPTFVAGLLFGWIRALTGSLWPAFLAHCAPEIGILLALWLR